MEYTIVVHPDEAGGYWTEVPVLPGCGSQGETVQEATETTRDAIEGYLESMKAHGDPVPRGKTIVTKITVAA